MNSNENPQKAQKAQNAQTSQTTVNRRPADVWATFEAQDAPALIDFLVGTVGFLRTGPWEHTGMTVAAVIFDFMSAGSMVRLSSISTSTGTAPSANAAAAVVTCRR